MAFTFEVAELSTPVVVVCKGKLTLGSGEELRNEVKVIAQMHKEIVLEMSHVDYVDSFGLGILVTAYVSARSAGCRLRLANLTTRVRNLLSLTQILRVIETFDHAIPPGVDQLP